CCSCTAFCRRAARVWFSCWSSSALVCWRCTCQQGKTVTSWQSSWFWLVDSSYALLDLMGAGGKVMWMLALLCILFWTLVLERFWYMRWHFPEWADERRQAWQLLCREEFSNGWPRTVRSAWIAQASEQLL